MTTSHEQQYVDPEVSRRKFDQQVADFRKLDSDYQARGWFLVHAEFPTIFVVMAAPQVSPPAVLTGVLLDYTNYDVRPPSVRLANPFTREPYARLEDLPTRLTRRTVQAVPGLPEGMQAFSDGDLMQAHLPDGTPFLCLPGVREYHDHPGHSGDPWELHRCTGAGTLANLLEVIHTYGVMRVEAWTVNLVPQIGLRMKEPQQ